MGVIPIVNENDTLAVSVNHQRLFATVLADHLVRKSNLVTTIRSQP